MRRVTAIFRFYIRDVLWLTVVAALAVSWWIDNKRIDDTLSRIQREQHVLTQELEDKITILNDHWYAQLRRDSDSSNKKS